MKTAPVSVGDYCTSYFKGIFRVIRLVDRTKEGAAPLAHLEQLVDSKYNQLKRYVQCDSAYCQKVTKEQLIQQAENTHKSFVEKLHENIPD